MSDGTLFIANRRYSSWSLRGWLAVRLARLDVEEKLLPLSGTGQTPDIQAVSPSGKLPTLHHRGAVIWESVAIADYCGEIAPHLWPADPAAHWFARSIAAEMHAGFRDLRIALPMVIGVDRTDIAFSPEVLGDIVRIERIWAEARSRFGAGGPYLFGATFGLADAMFAPVVLRFLAYHPPLSAAAQEYCHSVRNHPLVAAWCEGAKAEPEAWRRERYELK